MSHCDNCGVCSNNVEIHRLCDDCVQADIAEEEAQRAKLHAEIARLRIELEIERVTEATETVRKTLRELEKAP